MSIKYPFSNHGAENSKRRLQQGKKGNELPNFSSCMSKKLKLFSFPWIIRT